MCNKFEEQLEISKSRLKDLKQEFKELDRNYIEKDGINEKEHLYISRNGFSRDRDRIIFSRSFRRLEHKAQIYTHEKGDHFRTRLTHSLEVMQISRSIANNIGCNESLTEAIALGHDIGHTPFGHQGERTLDQILRGIDNLGGKIKFSINHGGFKHNIHSLRILERIEKKEGIDQGLNLSWQVLDGILKHTSIYKDGSDFKVVENIVHNSILNIAEILDKNLNIDYFTYSTPMTLEGQIVKISDEIAQRQHDIDDGLRDKGLNVNLLNIISNIIDEIKKIEQDDYDKSSSFEQEQYFNIIELMNTLDSIFRLHKSTMQISDESRLKFIRAIINFFIKDVTLNIHKNIHSNQCKVLINNGLKYITNEIATYSKYGQKINDLIEGVINTQILNSYDVNRFDGKAVFIVRQIFKAYYENPNQMPQYIRDRMMNDIHSLGKTYSLKIEYKHKETIKEFSLIDMNFSKSQRNDLSQLIDLMKLNFEEIALNVSGIRHNICFKEIQNSDLKLYNYCQPNNGLCESEIMEIIIKLNGIYLRNITDYIAGMTDNYAKSEYKNLYLV